MDQMISLEGHLRFQPMIASAVLQVHPDSDVMADSSPLLTWLGSGIPRIGRRTTCCVFRLSLEN